MKAGKGEGVKKGGGGMENVCVCLCDLVLVHNLYQESRAG